MPNVSAAIDTFLTGGALVLDENGAASTPPVLLSGTIFNGGSATTTKPQFLIEPTGTTSTGWSTGGTLFGANAPSGFSGLLADFQVDGVSRVSVGNSSNGTLNFANYGVLACGSGQATSLGGAYYTHLTSARFELLGAIPLGFASSNTLNTADVFLSRVNAAIIGVLGASSAGASIELTEMTAPSAPGANKGRLYLEDNGSGKTRLMVIFASGAAQQIAIEP